MIVSTSFLTNKLGILTGSDTRLTKKQDSKIKTINSIDINICTAARPKQVNKSLNFRSNTYDQYVGQITQSKVFTAIKYLQLTVSEG